jgi:hypothetical protein
MTKIYITPPGFSGTASLSAASGLEIVEQGAWQFSQAGYNDGESFGVSLSYPGPANSGPLFLRAQNWTIPVIGNTLTAYTDPETGDTYPASQCRIQLVGRWQVTRQPNSNSFNSFGVSYVGMTVTDQGSRQFQGFPQSLITTETQYVIQGAAVQGGAQDTFSDHEFRCECSESTVTVNSNRLYQSNSLARPIWVYVYSKSWEIDA